MSSPILRPGSPAAARRFIARWLAGALALAMLSACALSPEQQQQVAATVHRVQDTTLTCPETRTDRCAIASRLHDLAVEERNRVALLEEGYLALLARIHGIRAARRSIEIQTYIFEADDAGALVLEELLAAARRGVRVRLLMDQLSAFADSELLARMTVAHQNLEIKVYNPSFGKSESNLLDYAGQVLCCFRALNHRMHNKVFVVDGRIGITGGRNYQNRYFGWDPQFNFLDRDVLLLGPEAQAMQYAFEDYWDHPRSRHAEYLLDVSSRILNGTTLQYEFALDGRHVAQMREAASDPTAVVADLGARLRAVEAVQFFSDTPNKLFENDRDRDTTLRIRRLLADAERSVVMQTPYLVLTRRATRLFRRLRNEHPDIEFVVSTNSLASTDSFPVYAISRKRRKTYLKTLDFSLYELKPQPAALAYWVPPEPRATGAAEDDLQEFPLINTGERLSLHAKSIVIDGQITMIGSHNFDPRSEDYNTEAGLIIWDEATAVEALSQIYLATEPANAWVVARAPQVPIISFFSGIIGTISRRLPIFDVWPFRYGTCYQLRPGHEPIAPDHPEFHARYEDVGEFPEVSAPLKQIQTELISAFGGLAKPLL